MAMGKLERHTSPCTDQIPPKVIKAGGRTIHSEIHNHKNSISNKDRLPEEW